MIANGQRRSDSFEERHGFERVQRAEFVDGAEFELPFDPAIGRSSCVAREHRASERIRPLLLVTKRK